MNQELRLYALVGTYVGCSGVGLVEGLRLSPEWGQMWGQQMKIENDLARGRTRVRFTIQEIEKYSGEDVPETVIKNWIYLGRNLDKTLKEISSIVEKSTDVSTIQSVDYRLGEIEKSLKQLQTTISLFADSFVEVGRILAFAASYQLKKAEHESPELRRFLKARDEDYLSYFKDIFPKFKPGYLVKRFFRGGDQ